MQKKHQFKSSIMAVSTCIVGVIWCLCMARTAVAAEITRVLPESGPGSSIISIYGSGFGDTMGTNTVRIAPQGEADVCGNGTYFATTIPDPETANWKNMEIHVELREGMALGTYDVVVCLGTDEIRGSTMTFTVIADDDEVDYIGNPVESEDFQIQPGDQVNLSEAIRTITQGFLFPLKNTITEISSYVYDSLFFNLTLTGTTQGAKVDQVWEVTRSLANALVVVLLVAMGFMFIFRVALNSYEIRRVLPRLLLTVLGINISLVIARVILDLTLVTSYVIRDMLPLPDPGDLAASLFGNLYLNVFVIIAFIIVILIILLLALTLLMLLLRILLIYLLIVISPFVMLFLLFPGKHQVVVNWLKRLSLLAILGPLVTFIMYVGVFVSESVYSAFVDNSGLMRAFVGMATAGLVIVLPFILDSFFANFGQRDTQKDDAVPQGTDHTSNTSTSSTRTTITREEKKQAVEYQEKRNLTLANMDLSKLSPASFFKKKPMAPDTEPVVDTSAPLVQGKIAKKQSPVLRAEKRAVPAPTPAPAEQKAAQPGQNTQEQVPATQTKAEAPVRETAQPVQAAPVRSPESARQSAHYQRVRKLFNAIPRNLLLNILNDSEKKSLIRDGIVAEGREIESERAVTIFDAQTGRDLLSEMNVSNDIVERNAAGALIGKVFMAYPDRMQQIADTKASSSSPTAQQTAFALLQTGVRQLAREFVQTPEDERLQKAAERLVHYAPRMISAMTSQEGDDHQEFIQYGIRKLASTVGSTLRDLDRQSPLRTQVALMGEKRQQILGYRDLSAEVLGRAELDIVPFLENETDRMFIAGAALSRSEFGTQVMQKVSAHIAEHQDEPADQSLAAMIFQQVEPSEIKSLPPSILMGTNALLNSPEYQKKNDLALMYSYLNVIDQPAIGSLPLLDAQQFMRADAHMFTPLAPESDQKRIRFGFPAQAILSTAFPSLKEYAPHLVTQAIENLPQLLPVDQNLAYRAALKLYLDGDEKTASAPQVREIVKKVIEQSAQDSSVCPESQLKTVAHTYLKSVSTEESSHFAETEALTRQLYHHGLAGAPEQLPALRSLAPQVLEPALISLMAPADAARMVSYVPWEQVGSMSQTPLGSALAAGTASAVKQGTAVDGETLAKYVLMTPQDQLNAVPWELIKQVLEFLVKMDHAHPLYAELTRRVEPLTRAEMKVAQQVVSEPVTNALSAIAAADLAALKSIDADTVKKALDEARTTSEIQPEAAAKLLKVLSMEQLNDTPASVRDGATRYLSTRQHYSPEDAETAARLVTATPRDMLGKLNENILTLAATIAESNVSFADRDQLQVIISKELQDLIGPKGGSAATLPA